MMFFWVSLAVAAAGGVGSVCRFTLDGFVKSRTRLAYPLGTTVINITGSFFLGFVTALALAHALPDAWKSILGTGLIGGYTTFSTASFETVRLAQEGRWGAATMNGFGMFAGAIIAGGIGLWLGGFF